MVSANKSHIWTCRQYVTLVQHTKGYSFFLTFVFLLKERHLAPELTTDTYHRPKNSHLAPMNDKATASGRLYGCGQLSSAPRPAVNVLVLGLELGPEEIRE